MRNLMTASHPLVTSLLLALIGSCLPVLADPIYDEALVPHYELPDPLVSSDGSRITTAQQWQSSRRPEVMALFEQHVYGKIPDTAPLRYELLSFDRAALRGLATRREVRIYFHASADQPHMDLLIYLPNAPAALPAPLFLGLNFGGNQSVHPDPAIRLSKSWMRNRPDRGYSDHRASESTRGSASSRWPIELIVERGYGIATSYYGDIDPDFHDGFRNGVHGLLDNKGSQPRDSAAWGSISAWAWGLSRAMDHLQKDPTIDGERICLLGHSRLGKTALWAGANDERFALVVSNNSGCGGAALSRRRFGESVKAINTSFPHWFNDNFKRFNDNENRLPVDQHMLVALIAPRPVLICSAQEDRWADPRGEFLAAKGADSVYRLLGTDGCSMQAMPGLEEPVTSTIGYRIRPGKHDVTFEDWQAYLDFADRHLSK